MNYRHIYHAGNFADVLKHCVLLALLHTLLRKETPFCYLETHAGAGRYDLRLGAAQKTREYERGIARVLQAADPPARVQEYLAIVRALNPELDPDSDPDSDSDSAAPHTYPGSPRIARAMLRPQDRMCLMELHASEYHALRHEFVGDKQVAVHHLDGYQGLKAFLPPQERRGLVLIDPPFEEKEEFHRLTQALEAALVRWETGVYAVWYPLKQRDAVDAFRHAVGVRCKRGLLSVEFDVGAAGAQNGLRGAGMTIVHPPWKLREALLGFIPWLWKALSPAGEGGYRFLSA